MEDALLWNSEAEGLSGTELGEMVLGHPRKLIPASGRDEAGYDRGAVLVPLAPGCAERLAPACRSCRPEVCSGSSASFGFKGFL